MGQSRHGNGVIVIRKNIGKGVSIEWILPLSDPLPRGGLRGRIYVIDP